MHYLIFDHDLGVKVTQNMPSTLYIMLPIQLQSFEVATFNGLGGDTFTRNVTDRRGTDFGTKFIYPFF